jgi:protocatechuate 3,4-dioxygenase beta subunit
MAGAKIELWQANAAGRYSHPQDDNPAPLDPGFQGTAIINADESGAFRFKTVKPGPYDGGTPHIHFDVTAGSQRLVTQMIFEDEPLNTTDGLVQALPPRARETITARRGKATAGSSEPIYSWDIVVL